jgi:C4-dicarboxylate transporter DctQ subunit
MPLGEQFRNIFSAFFRFYSLVAAKVAAICTVIGYFLLVAVTLVVGLAVLTRYVLNNPLQWTEETARYLLIWLTMIASSVAIKQRAHIRLETVTVRIPKLAATIVEIVLYTIIVVLVGFLARASYQFLVTQSTMRYSASIGIPMFWPHLILPTGFVLMVFQAVFILLEDIKFLLELPNEKALRRVR